jgi:hypothetical protein
MRYARWLDALLEQAIVSLRWEQRRTAAASDVGGDALSLAESHEPGFQARRAVERGRLERRDGLDVGEELVLGEARLENQA